MKLNLPEEITEILFIAKEEALRTGNKDIGSETLVLSILRHQENLVCDILSELKVPTDKLKKEIDSSIITENTIPYNEDDNITFSSETQNILKRMYEESEIQMEKEPSAIYLFIAILYEGNANTKSILANYNLSPTIIKDFLLFDKDKIVNINENENGEETDFATMSESNPNNKQSLANYSFDLTKAAKDGKLDPVVGRENEIIRLAQILGRRKKNNPIIVGEPGVGKSAIVEGLAHKIAKHQVSRNLLNKRIISLDIASIVAGTKFRGQFEERIKNILKEVKESNDIILFIDEIHTLVGAGGAVGSLDAANMLKPALARGEIQCIGATTLDEYREVIEKDGALERRFQKIIIEQTNYEETLNILKEISPYYEKHHNVSYTNESLEACISLSNRYISDRCQPDKSIDVLDEAGARLSLKHYKPSSKLIKLEKESDSYRKEKLKAIRNKDFESAGHLHFLENLCNENISDEIAKWEKKQDKNKTAICSEDISNVISIITGIPANKIALTENNRLLEMSTKIKEQIIGQDNAVDKVVSAIKRSRAGLKDPQKPIGTFLFLGPTGVGKTQLAKVLAEYLFDSKDNIIRIDMSEYMEKYAVSRLIGAPPGYVGYGEGGQLTEKVRRKPYSVILLDEIEKAHSDIYNLLLQVLDEGRLTDSNGRKVDFRNTILIMTSNIGSKELEQYGAGLGYSNSTKRDASKQNKVIIDKAISKTFNPEFINRIDDQIVFSTLTKDVITKIVEIELKDLHNRCKENGFKISVSKVAKSFIAEIGYDPKYGARPLKRSIQKFIEDPLADFIIGNSINSEKPIKIDLNKSKDDIIIKQ